MECKNDKIKMDCLISNEPFKVYHCQICGMVYIKKVGSPGRWYHRDEANKQEIELNPEHLKCCGNCKNRISNMELDEIKENCGNEFLSYSHQVCIEWEYDGLKNTQRVVK